MNILFISPFLAEEHGLGGMKRFVSFVRYLQTNHNVTVACLDNRTQVTYGPKIEVENVHVFSGPKYGVFRRVLHKLFAAKPSIVLHCMSSDMARAIRDIVKEREIELVHIEFGYAGEYLRWIDRSRSVVVLAEQEVLSRSIMTKIAYRKMALSSLLSIVDYLKIRRYENRLWPLFDMTFAISRQEQKLISNGCPDLDVGIYPNVVDTRSFMPGPMGDLTMTGDGIVFVGNFLHKPNETGILWFCNFVFPLIIREMPCVRLCVVGANPTPEVKSLARRRNIVVTGTVDDVRPYVRSCSVFINPVLTGGGMRGKLLEAMALKKAVVSTSLGAEGIEAVHGEHIFLADSCDEFARHILYILRTEGVQAEVGESARALVEQYYDEQVVFRRMEGLYQELVNSHRQTRRQPADA